MKVSRSTPMTLRNNNIRRRKSTVTFKSRFSRRWILESARWVCASCDGRSDDKGAQTRSTIGNTKDKRVSETRRCLCGRIVIGELNWALWCLRTKGRHGVDEKLFAVFCYENAFTLAQRAHPTLQAQEWFSAPCSPELMLSGDIQPANT